MKVGLEFHHLGMACADVAGEAEQQSLLGYVSEGPDFEDPFLGVRGRFIVGGGPRIELLEALPGSRTLEPWLTGGNRIYHQAYTASSFSAALVDLSSTGARQVVPPCPAVAFGGRMVSFFVLRTMVLVEVIEGPLREPSGAS